MSIIEYRVFDKLLYLNTANGDVSDNRAELEENISRAFDPEIFVQSFRPKYYSFCLNISDQCNLHCSYCFNPDKKKKLMGPDEAVAALERFFSIFPNGEKYFVDLSGKGEPLLNKKAIAVVADYCHKKSDEIRREVLPMLVCNGTLLNEGNVEFLQNAGVLFGVSLDGPREIHDENRRTFTGEKTYDRIISNVKRIEHREYVGCAATLTSHVFPLTETIVELAETFNTLSFRLCRSKTLGLSQSSVAPWMREYDRLAKKLEADADVSDSKIFKCLMNGDDLFGRYLYRMFSNTRTLNRCDGMITRFTYDMDGHVYGCPASFGMNAFSTGLENVKERQISELWRQTTQCLACPFKLYCGGECAIEEEMHGGINKANCAFKIHLIRLASYLKIYVLRNNRDFFAELNAFCKEKRARYGIDQELRRFLEANPKLTFTEAKKVFDERVKRY